MEQFLCLCSALGETNGRLQDKTRRIVSGVASVLIVPRYSCMPGLMLFPKRAKKRFLSRADAKAFAAQSLKYPMPAWAWTSAAASCFRTF